MSGSRSNNKHKTNFSGHSLISRIITPSSHCLCLLWLSRCRHQVTLDDNHNPVNICWPDRDQSPGACNMLQRTLRGMSLQGLSGHNEVPGPVMMRVLRDYRPGHNSFDYLVSQAGNISPPLFCSHFIPGWSGWAGSDAEDQMHHTGGGSVMHSDAGQGGTSGVHRGWDHCYNLIIKLEWNIFVTWARAGNLQKHFTWSTRDAKNTQLNPWWEWEKKVYLV